MLGNLEAHFRQHIHSTGEVALGLLLISCYNDNVIQVHLGLNAHACHGLGNGPKWDPALKKVVSFEVYSQERPVKGVHLELVVGSRQVYHCQVDAVDAIA